MSPTPPRPRRASRSARPTSSTSAAPSRAASPAGPTRCTDAKGTFLANAAPGSRKDARDAVVAARGAFGGWSAATAYNRGQVLYRVAEMMEGRRAQFVDEVAAAEGLPARAGGAAGRRGDRPLGLVRRAGPTRSPRCSAG